MGRRGGGTPPRSVLSWSENPATGRLSRGGFVQRDGGDLRPSLYLSPSGLLTPLSLLLLPRLSRFLLFLPLRRSSPSVELSSTERLKNCPEFDFFSFLWMRGAMPQLLPGSSPSLCFHFSFTPVFSTISLSVGSASPPPPPCQPGCLASCPIPLKRKRRSR